MQHHSRSYPSVTTCIPGVAVKMVDIRTSCASRSAHAYAQTISSMLIDSVLQQQIREYKMTGSQRQTATHAKGKPVIRITLLGKAARLDLLAKAFPLSRG